MVWQSTVNTLSKIHPGVEFVIIRMSFGRRLELMKRVRDLAARAEFFEAGCDEKNRMEASLLGAEMDRLYLEWGLAEVRGLELDGVPASPLVAHRTRSRGSVSRSTGGSSLRVRPERARKKKLIVAFHFQAANEQFAGRAGWDCDKCRKHGLDVSRRCGFIPLERRGPARVVWGRKQIQSEECPKSLVTGTSLALLEEFLVRRRLGIQESLETEARKIDAFLILREQMEREERDVTTQH
jgi:hypothetical protein